MDKYTLVLTLESDTTLGRGDGVAGLVDAEVEHDRYGMPFLHGRALKGLLEEECANILFALVERAQPWHQAAQDLFGRPGSVAGDGALMHVGDARLPPGLRSAVVADVDGGKYSAAAVLESLTAIRRQTAMDETGVPDRGSLRSMRVILRETTLEAELTFAEPPTEEALALLAACVMALRHVGTGRNRGRGVVMARLCDAERNDVTHSAQFEEEVR